MDTMRKTVSTIVLGLSLLGSILLGTTWDTGISHAAASLPSGSWNMDANGFTGTLSLNPPDGAGNLTGTMFGQPIIGYYDSTSQKITFMRETNRRILDTVQVFTGYLFHTGSVNDLAGSFVAFNGTGASAGESEFGWFATQ
jgi:hypothetical protein